MEKISVTKLFKKYVKNTEKESIVPNAQTYVSSITNAVFESGYFISPKVYINTRVLKHLYDKRTAESFDVIIQSIWQIIRFPDSIYTNQSSKRGKVALVKQINKFKYFCSIESSKDENFIVTVFRTDEDYLKKYELVWSWKGGVPSS